MILAKFAVEKRVVSALATLLILAAGYLAYQKLPRFEDPEFIIRQAQVITSYPGASAVEVADEVTDAIETAAQQLQGVKRCGRFRRRACRRSRWNSPSPRPETVPRSSGSSRG